MVNLTASNNDTESITAVWDSPDNNREQYSYKIILQNKSSVHTIYTSREYKKLDNLIAGTNYTLNVSPIEPNCSEEGETVSILAYTSE